MQSLSSNLSIYIISLKSAFLPGIKILVNEVRLLQ